MKTLTVLLSTAPQTVKTVNILDHYVFYDPISGYTFTYPNTANGGFYSTTSWPVTANDGTFLNWSYGITTTRYSINVGTLSGTYTITFCPSAISDNIYPLTKIVYNFANEEQTEVIDRTLVVNYSAIDILTFSERGEDLGNPKYTWPDSVYVCPKTGSITYYPSVTAFYSNLAVDVFDITFTIVPGSILDIGAIHLLNTTESASLSSSLNVFETVEPNYVSVIKLNTS